MPTTHTWASQQGRRAQTAGFVEPWAIVPYLDGYAVTDAKANVVRYLVGNEVKNGGRLRESGEDGRLG